MDGGAGVDTRSILEGAHHLGKGSRGYIRRVLPPPLRIYKSPGVICY